MNDQLQEAQRSVQNFRQESLRYMQQFHIWLGIGSAGGAIALMSLAANMADPKYALEFILPQLEFGNRLDLLVDCPGAITDIPNGFFLPFFQLIFEFCSFFSRYARSLNGNSLSICSQPRTI